ncbi:hypothetical protein F5Y11DRAFT_359093 [Daldinia sp. FL1419]|nr:hypothetical protein F5Y11DRAFT_359093 [Daldinia sp. FL1419]
MAPVSAPSESDGDVTLAVSGVIIALATMSVALRFYTRKFTRLGLKADDWLIMAAVVAALATAALLLWGNSVDPDGLRATENTNPDYVYTAEDVFYLKLSFVSSILYFTIAGATKLGILLMYYRIFAVSTAFRYQLFLSVALVIGWWVGCTVATLTNCIPLEWSWINSLSDARYCFDYNIFWMASGACEIFLDVLILALPISVIVRMRLSTKRKVTISIIFLLGGLTIITVDMDYVQAFEATQPDYPPGLVRRLYYSHGVSINEDNDASAPIAEAPIIQRFHIKQGSWETESITIQDPAMRRFLDDVFEEYKNLNLKKANWTFRPPFQPLVHRWNEIEKYATIAEYDSDSDFEMSDLLLFLTPIVKHPLSPFARIEATGTTDFTNIWHIFPPGCLVVSHEWDVDVISRVLRCKKCTIPGEAGRTWKIDVEYIDWDGKDYGYRDHTLRIKHFDGYRRVTDLDVYPISYREDEAEFRATFISKGHKFEDSRDYTTMACIEATTVWEEPTQSHDEWSLQQVKAGSRFYIDPSAYYDCIGHGRPTMRPFYDDDTDSEDNEARLVVRPRAAYQLQSASPETSLVPDISSSTKKNLRPFTDEERLIIYPWLRGFRLQTKTWCKIRIEDLQDVNWNELAFQRLLLPNDEKEALLRFIMGNLRFSNLVPDDFVQNKKRGLTCLLLGPPGVGKAFTVEAIADKLRLPLYSISAADLDNRKVTSRGSMWYILKLCSSWNAILLVKNADFLFSIRGRPKTGEHPRRTIPLNKLADHETIVFLTANEGGDISPILRAHINFVIPYKPLDTQARRQIWQNLVEDAGIGSFMCDSENLGAALDELSEFDLNGHDIRSIINSAKILASEADDCDQKISLEDLRLLARNFAP